MDKKSVGGRYSVVSASVREVSILVEVDSIYLIRPKKNPSSSSRMGFFLKARIA